MSKEIIEKDLSVLVNSIVNNVPKLKSVRVFESYLTDKWNPEKSDIDIFILTADENYKYKNDYIWIDKSSTPISRRIKLIEEILNPIEGKYKDKFSLHLYTKSEMPQIMFAKEGREYLGLAMIKGRHLYGQKNIFDYLSQLI